MLAAALATCALLQRRRWLLALVAAVVLVGLLTATRDGATALHSLATFALAVAR